MASERASTWGIVSCLCLCVLLTVVRVSLCLCLEMLSCEEEGRRDLVLRCGW